MREETTGSRSSAQTASASSAEPRPSGMAKVPAELRSPGKRSRSCRGGGRKGVPRTISSTRQRIRSGAAMATGRPPSRTTTWSQHRSSAPRSCPTTNRRPRARQRWTRRQPRTHTPTTEPGTTSPTTEAKGVPAGSGAGEPGNMPHDVRKFRRRGFRKAAGWSRSQRRSIGAGAPVVRRPSRIGREEHPALEGAPLLQIPGALLGDGVHQRRRVEPDRIGRGEAGLVVRPPRRRAGPRRRSGRTC